MIHPLQYEIETARHGDYQLRATQRREIAKAEQVVSGEMQSTPLLRSVTGRFNWRLLHMA